MPWTEEPGGLRSMGSQSRTRPSTDKHHRLANGGCLWPRELAGFAVSGQGGQGTGQELHMKPDITWKAPMFSETKWSATCQNVNALPEAKDRF